jgi:hypothetical protein
MGQRDLRDSVLTPLGRLVATPGALAATKPFPGVLADLLTRYQRQDWGDLEPSDKKQNDRAFKRRTDTALADRILAAYHLPDGTKIWIITEYDASVTTILLPEEY